jgi:hypothetical protein
MEAGKIKRRKSMMERENERFKRFESIVESEMEDLEKIRRKRE